MERSETGVWFEFSKQRRCTSFWVSCEYCLGKPQEWWHWYVKRKLKLMNFIFSHLLNIVPKFRAHQGETCFKEGSQIDKLLELEC